MTWEGRVFPRKPEHESPSYNDDVFLNVLFAWIIFVAAGCVAGGLFGLIEVLR